MHLASCVVVVGSCNGQILWYANHKLISQCQFASSSCTVHYTTKLACLRQVKFMYLESAKHFACRRDAVPVRGRHSSNQPLVQSSLCLGSSNRKKQTCFASCITDGTHNCFCSMQEEQPAAKQTAKGDLPRPSCNFADLAIALVLLLNS